MHLDTFLWYEAIFQPDTAVRAAAQKAQEKSKSGEKQKALSSGRQSQTSPFFYGKAFAAKLSPHKNFTRTRVMFLPEKDTILSTV